MKDLVVWLTVQIVICLISGAQSALTQHLENLLQIKTCGRPNIANNMNNVTAKPGQTATFKCQIDMSCIVSYIEWYHEMDNGTEKLIKTASSSGDPQVHQIKGVQAADEGLYTCIAGNVMGQATASAYLEVNQARPSVSSHLMVVALSSAVTQVLLPSLCWPLRWRLNT